MVCYGCEISRSSPVDRARAEKAGNIYDRLADFADWASNGGISGADIPVNESVVMQLLVATRNWITLQENDEPTMWSFTQRTFEEAIAHFHARADGPEDDYYSPILSFVRDIAIANAPERYWQFVSREKRDRVYGPGNGARKLTPFRRSGTDPQGVNFSCRRCFSRGSDGP